MNRRFFLSALAFTPFSKLLAAAAMAALEPIGPANTLHVTVHVPELKSHERVVLLWAQDAVRTADLRYHYSYRALDGRSSI